MVYVASHFDDVQDAILAFAYMNMNYDYRPHSYISFTHVNLEIDLVAFDANELPFPERLNLVLFQNKQH